MKNSYTNNIIDLKKVIEANQVEITEEGKRLKELLDFASKAKSPEEFVSQVLNSPNKFKNENNKRSA
jgi:hypothetical protein